MERIVDKPNYKSAQFMPLIIIISTWLRILYDDKFTRRSES